MNLDLVPVTCLQCGRTWEYPGSDQERMVEVLAEIAGHIRGVHGDEQLALKVERLAISSGSERQG